MEVKLAGSAGFCFGVKRALKIARQTLKLAADCGKLPVYTFGPLVHNPQVVDALEKDGLKVLENFAPAPRGFLIIRSHGVSPEIKQQAERAGFKIVDATCPLVKKIHKLARALQKEKYSIIIVGHKGHPEVQGIAGFAGENHFIIENQKEAKNLPKLNKVGVLAQTTAPFSEFKKIVRVLLEKSNELRVFNTICFEGQKRQLSTRKLAKMVDLIVVVGGKNSSNTLRLVEVGLSQGKPVLHLESPQELKPETFAGINSVGLTAGASTPQELLLQVLQKLQEF